MQQGKSVKDMTELELLRHARTMEKLMTQHKALVQQYTNERNICMAELDKREVVNSEVSKSVEKKINKDFQDAKDITYNEDASSDATIIKDEEPK